MQNECICFDLMHKPYVTSLLSDVCLTSGGTKPDVVSCRLLILWLWNNTVNKKKTKTLTQESCQRRTQAPWETLSPEEACRHTLCFCSGSQRGVSTQTLTATRSVLMEPYFLLMKSLPATSLRVRRVHNVRLNNSPSRHRVYPPPTQVGLKLSHLLSGKERRHSVSFVAALCVRNDLFVVYFGARLVTLIWDDVTFGARDIPRHTSALAESRAQLMCN